MLIGLAVAFAQDASPEEDVDEVVVVTASRSETLLSESPVHVEVITREEIEATGAESVGELLEEQPGVLVDDTFAGVAVRLQGMEPEHTLFLIDGQRVIGRKDGVIDLSRLTPDAIERIEIVKGPSSALYGSDAMGGVVHIITRRAERAREVGLHLRGGMYDRLDLTGDVSLPGEVMRHRVSAGWHASDAWDLNPEDPATTSSGYHQGDLAWNATVDTGPDSRVELRASWLQRRLSGVDASNTGAIFDREQAIEEGRAGVDGWRLFGANTKVSGRLSGSIFRDQFLSDQRASREQDQFAVTLERLGEASVQVDQAAGAQFVTVGVDALAQGLTSDRLGPGKGDRQRLAFFAQDQITFGRGGDVRVQIVPGARLDLDTQFGRAFTPRLALSLATDAVTVRGGFGTGFRAPDFRELYLYFENPGVGYLVGGNPELRPERSVNGNAGVEVQVAEPLWVSISAYWNEIEDLITIGNSDTEPGALLVFSYENISRARTRGGEVQTHIDVDPVSVELGYALTDTLDLDLDRPLPGRPPHRVTGAVSVDLPASFKVRAQTGISGPRAFYLDTDGDEVEERFDTPTLVTTDLRAVWQGDPVEVFAGVDNLFDATAEGALTPLMPRFVYAGFNVRARKEGR